MRPASVLIFLAGVVVGAGAYRLLFGDAPAAASSSVEDRGRPAMRAKDTAMPRAGAAPAVDRGMSAAVAAPVTDRCEDDPSACMPDIDEIVARAEREWELAMIARAIAADPMKNTAREVTEVERLQAYEDFALEPVDPAFRAKIEGRVQSGLETLTGIDYDTGLELIDCRTDSCLARIRIPPGEDYLNAIGGLEGLLPISGIAARKTALGGEQFVDVYLTNIVFVEPIGERGKRLAPQAGPD